MKGPGEGEGGREGPGGVGEGADDGAARRVDDREREQAGAGVGLPPSPKGGWERRDRSGGPLPPRPTSRGHMGGVPRGSMIDGLIAPYLTLSVILGISRPKGPRAWANSPVQRAAPPPPPRGDHQGTRGQGLKGGSGKGRRGAGRVAKTVMELRVQWVSQWNAVAGGSARRALMGPYRAVRAYGGRGGAPPPGGATEEPPASGLPRCFGSSEGIDGGAPAHRPLQPPWGPHIRHQT